MPFTVELREGVHERPAIQRLPGVVLPLDRIEEEKWRFPVLRGLDPYSDTYFGQLQMKDLFEELTALAQDFEGDTRTTLERLIDLAEMGSSHSHHYLVFLAD